MSDPLTFDLLPFGHLGIRRLTLTSVAPIDFDGLGVSTEITFRITEIEWKGVTEHE